jgi:hypothetical protein
VTSFYDPFESGALILTSQLVPLYCEYVQLQRSISENQIKAENLEEQLNIIRTRITLFDGKSKASSRRIFEKLLRTLTFRLLSCRETHTNLVANMAIIAEQLEYVRQHQWRYSYHHYEQHTHLSNTYPTRGRQVITLPSVPNPPLSPLLVSPASPSSPSASSTLRWTNLYSENLGTNSPHIGSRNMNSYEHSPHYCTLSSPSPESPLFTNPQTYPTIPSSNHTELWQNWAFNQPSTLTCHSHGPHSSIDLLSPLTNLNLNRDHTSWPSPSPDKITHPKNSSISKSRKKSLRP